MGRAAGSRPLSTTDSNRRFVAAFVRAASLGGSDWGPGGFLMTTLHLSPVRHNVAPPAVGSVPHTPDRLASIAGVVSVVDAFGRQCLGPWS
jgi:hypothetical protein